MGLSSTLSNALGGMNASQRGIDVLSRNVANQGTPGYHRQSLVIQESAYGTSSQVRTAGLNRAFNEALQQQHIAAVSSSGFQSARVDLLERLQMHLGKPGDANSLDTLYAGLENAFQAMATNPNDVTTRAGVVNAAQALVEQLNTLSGAVQEMRRESEYQISNSVSDLNRQLKSLADINQRILDLSQDESARASLMDERDRLVTSIAENVDIRTTYRADGTVALATESGISLLDVLPSEFKFQTGGNLTGTSRADGEGSTGVGTLTLRTPSGYEIDVGAQDLLTSGKVAGLLEMRDTTLVNAQDQLDEIAAGLALAMNTVTEQAEAVEDPGGDTFTLDLANMQPGNSMLVNYTQDGVEQTARIVRVDDPTALPLKSPNAKGETVIGLDFSNGMADVATALDGQLGDIAVSASGDALTLQNAGDETVKSFASYTTVTGNQTGAEALNLFLDMGNVPFTNSLDGVDQKIGFSGRIKLNPAVIGDNTLLTKFEGNTSLGDPTRAQFLLNSMKSMEFVSERVTDVTDGGVRLSGRLGDMISQMINHQGNTVATGQNKLASTSLTLDSINTRMQSEYGVNVDEEMARLMRLQNAYSASARVVSTVQELINSLLRM